MARDEEQKIALATPEEMAQYGGASSSAPCERDGAASTEPASPPEREVAELKAQLAEMRDKHLRAQAECVNVARRVNDEKAQAVRRANAAFARDLLPILDDFDRMFASFGERPPDDPHWHGVQLLRESLIRVLRSHRVTPIEAVGRPFDPKLHEAVMHQPSDDVEEGVVVADLARGYLLDGELLRAAKVVVARRSETGATPGA